MNSFPVGALSSLKIPGSDIINFEAMSVLQILLKIHIMTNDMKPVKLCHIILHY